MIYKFDPVTVPSRHLYCMHIETSAPSQDYDMDGIPHAFYDAFGGVIMEKTSEDLNIAFTTKEKAVEYCTLCYEKRLNELRECGIKPTHTKVPEEYELNPDSIINQRVSPEWQIEWSVFLDNKPLKTWWKIRLSAISIVDYWPHPNISPARVADMKMERASEGSSWVYVDDVLDDPDSFFPYGLSID